MILLSTHQIIFRKFLCWEGIDHKFLQKPGALKPFTRVFTIVARSCLQNMDGDKMDVEEAGVGVSLQVKSEGDVRLELRQEETEVDKLQQILNEHSVFLKMTGMFFTIQMYLENCGLLKRTSTTCIESHCYLLAFNIHFAFGGVEHKHLSWCKTNCIFMAGLVSLYVLGLEGWLFS